jgi:hypothetical protein
METWDAASALEAKKHAEAQMARAATCPPWRHAAFGLLMGGLIATPAFAMPIRTSILVLILCCIPLIIQSDRKRMGMFINGYRRGKTRIVAMGILIAELALYTVAVIRGLDHHDQVTPLVLGAVGVVIGILGSMLWQRVFVSEMSA